MRHPDAAPGPMLAAFDQNRSARAVGVAECPEIADARAVAVAGVGDDAGWKAHRRGQAPALVRDAGQQQGRRGRLHRMDVEQEVGVLDQRPQLARPLELARAARAVQGRRAPDPVQIFVEIAGSLGIFGIERIEGSEVDERQRQASAAGPDAPLEQPQQRPGPAQLVAVHQRGDHHVRARLAAVERGHVGNAAVAAAVHAQIRRGDFDGGAGHRIRPPPSRAPAGAGTGRNARAEPARRTRRACARP